MNGKGYSIQARQRAKNLGDVCMLYVHTYVDYAMLEYYTVCDTVMLMFCSVFVSFFKPFDLSMICCTKNE